MKDNYGIKKLYGVQEEGTGVEEEFVCKLAFCNEFSVHGYYLLPYGLGIVPALRI